MAFGVTSRVLLKSRLTGPLHSGGDGDGRDGAGDQHERDHHTGGRSEQDGKVRGTCNSVLSVVEICCCRPWECCKALCVPLLLCPLPVSLVCVLYCMCGSALLDMSASSCYCCYRRTLLSLPRHDLLQTGACTNTDRRWLRSTHTHTNKQHTIFLKHIIIIFIIIIPAMELELVLKRGHCVVCFSSCC